VVKMEIEYDKEADALYVYFLHDHEGDVKTIPIADYPDIFLDVTKDGKLIGIEILDASKKVDMEHLKTLQFRRIDKKK